MKTLHHPLAFTIYFNMRSELSNWIEAYRDLPNTDKAVEALLTALKRLLRTAMTSPLTDRFLCLTHASSVIVRECQNLEFGEKARNAVCINGIDKHL